MELVDGRKKEYPDGPVAWQLGRQHHRWEEYHLRKSHFQCIFLAHCSFFLSRASRRSSPWLATPGKRAWGKPTSDRHPHALKGIGCGPASITPALGVALFAFTPRQILWSTPQSWRTPPATGIDLSHQTLVHTPLLVHASYVTSRATNDLHAGYLIQGDETHPIPLH